jgi:hypothetical protein
MIHLLAVNGAAAVRVEEVENLLELRLLLRARDQITILYYLILYHYQMIME